MFNVILYTHNSLPAQFEEWCFRTLNNAVSATSTTEGVAPDLIVVSSSPFRPISKPWRNILAHSWKGRGLHDCYVKIVAALQAARHAQTFLVEHDVLYPVGYFDFVPPRDRNWHYNVNVWRQNRRGYFPCGSPLTSQCCADRDALLDLFEKRIELIECGGRVVWDEPGRNPGDTGDMIMWESVLPAVDIRWGGNLTGPRDGANPIQQLQGWLDNDKAWDVYGLNTEDASQ